MGGVGKVGVSGGGGVSGWWRVWHWVDRVLTLVWAGQVWVWACLGVVAHFRYLLAGILGVSSDCVGVYSE